MFSQATFMAAIAVAAGVLTAQVVANMVPGLPRF